MQTKFHGKAQAYDQARPGYPDAAMRYIASLISACDHAAADVTVDAADSTATGTADNMAAGITSGTMTDAVVVADIGAGTGKFTVPLARLGFGVVAVEPDADMRGVLRDATRPYPNVTVTDGTAERTTLPDRSVDAITCAQALHWFDHDAFLAECARISRGESFLLISVYNSTSFDSAMMRGVDRGVPEPISEDGNVTDAVNAANVSRTADAVAVSTGDAADIGVSARHFRETAAEFFTHPTIRRFPNPIRYTRESWRTYMDSHSHSPLPTDPEYPAHRAWVDAIFDARAVDGILTDDNVTMVASERIRVR
ncbi:class I SAM-dependent methyltransferase [Bifidobacterium ramosum]|nr:class I SAM-dependent methyltransferase [Bifidobacterium ramosum]NEG71438.1 methyltransferase domain-containing protein [Bifidobacterium ramosum]